MKEDDDEGWIYLSAEQRAKAQAMLNAWLNKAMKTMTFSTSKPALDDTISTMTGDFAGCLSKGDIVTITNSNGVSETVMVGAVHALYFKIKGIPWCTRAIWAFFEVFPFLHWRFVPV